MSKLKLQIEELEARIAPGVTINPPGLDSAIDIGGGSGFNENPPAPYASPGQGTGPADPLPAPAIAQLRSGGVVFW